jgi:hypothetical protein
LTQKKDNDTFSVLMDSKVIISRIYYNDERKFHFPLKPLTKKPSLLKYLCQIPQSYLLTSPSFFYSDLPPCGPKSFSSPHAAVVPCNSSCLINHLIVLSNKEKIVMIRHSKHAAYFPLFNVNDWRNKRRLNKKKNEDGNNNEKEDEKKENIDENKNLLDSNKKKEADEKDFDEDEFFKLCNKDGIPEKSNLRNRPHVCSCRDAMWSGTSIFFDPRRPVIRKDCINDRVV